MGALGTTITAKIVMSAVMAVARVTAAAMPPVGRDTAANEKSADVTAANMALAE
jgi:hypothetical protein